MHGLWSIEQVNNIRKVFPDALMEVHDDSSGTKLVKGNFKDIHYDQLITFTSGDIADKMARYEELVISMLKDQWAWIKDKSHQRQIDETNAVESLRIAETATIEAVKY